MSRRLPPLNALRAFEAAARHLSITQAAEELHVTTAAISRQVKVLEDHLGVQLFRRHNRTLSLTAAGQTCLPALREGFDRLSEALIHLRTAQDREVLTASISPSFAEKWLVSRLGRFQQAYPDIDVHLTNLADGWEPNCEEVDLVIRRAPCPKPGMLLDRLLGVDVFPVCSPTLLAGPKPLRKPTDLHGHTLLHIEGGEVDTASPHWRSWLRAAGACAIDPTRGPSFSSPNMGIQAAIAGQGVALCDSVLVEEDLIAGRLVQPFKLTYPATYAYFILRTEAAARRPKVEAFRRWLLEEAAIFEGQHHWISVALPASCSNRAYNSHNPEPTSQNTVTPEEEAPTYADLAKRVDKGTTALAAANARLHQEIRERKRAEETLRTSELQLRLFIEHSPVPIAMFDRDMRYLVASRRWLEHRKRKTNHVIGLCHYELFPECPERWKEAHRRGLNGAVVQCDEDPVVSAEGTTEWVRWELRPWRNTVNEISGIILFAEVITERVRTQAAVRASEHRYRSLYDNCRQKNSNRLKHH